MDIKHLINLNIKIAEHEQAEGHFKEGMLHAYRSLLDDIENIEHDDDEDIAEIVRMHMSGCKTGECE